MIVKRGDIFYADLSPVVGSEQGGLRPVLIVQNDVGNRYSPTVIAAAITSKTGKAKLPTHIDVSGDPDQTPGLARDSVILLEQVRTIDKRRLRERIGRLDLYTMQKVNSAISVSFGLSDEPSAVAVATDTPLYHERAHLHSAVASVGASHNIPGATVSHGTQSVPLSTDRASIGSDTVKLPENTPDAVFCSANTLSDTETNANGISVPHAVFETVASTAAEVAVNTLPLHPFSSDGEKATTNG